MRRLAFCLLALLGAAPAFAQDDATCGVVHLSDVGWTDAAATNGLATDVLNGLGYETKTPLLALVMGYVAMREGRVDAFLDDWEPAGHAGIAPFLADGSVVDAATNLSHAHLSLAVPDYVWNAGLHDFHDIAGWGSRLGYMIFGLEAGNDNNAVVLRMIHDNMFGIGRFRLVESSEQGMLTQLDRDVQSSRPIVFLAWEPHPMNMRFSIHYLTGGEAAFGPDGGVSVHTILRQGYAAQCPNVARFLAQMRFTVPMENGLMAEIHDSGHSGQLVALQWLRTHPDDLARWLDGVTTRSGAPGLAAVVAYLNRPETAEAMSHSR